MDIATGERAAAAVHERCVPSVVGIGRRPGRGTGVVVDPGVVVTNAHNLRGATTTVRFADGREATGTVAGVDGDGDLAAITVDTGGARPIDWVDGAPDPAVGQVVFGLGALPEGGARLTVGTVSATGQAFRGPGGRLIPAAIEHTAPAAPGSSGGPVVDREGRLVGLNTHRLGDGFYLAVPATDDLHRRLRDLARGQSPTRPRLGVALVPPAAARRLREAVGLPAREGLLLAGVDAGGPAGRAGLQRGDLLVAADGRDLRDVDDLAAALEAGGAEVRLRYLRHLGEHEAVVLLGGEGA